MAAENVGSSRRISGDRLFDFVSNELKGSVQEPIRMGWGRSITLVTYPQLDISTDVKVALNQENPYRGLYAFESEQAQYFCGRDEAVRTLISRLAESHFLAVIGYSGSGKSSLVKAGLLPQLKRDRLPGSSEWAIASFTPGEHPLGKLVDILTRQQQQNKPHLLFIDQFEEVFTLCQDDEERKAFIRLIAQEVKKGEAKTRIILTIRGDFLNLCPDYLEIITLINSIPPTSFIVTPMSLAELEEAIEKPAKLHGVTFEHSLVSQISADVFNRPGALPILQYALKELWRVCIEEPESPEPLLTRKGYEEIGGVKGALDKRATILYESLTTIDQAFARRLFMELVQLSEAREVTRRRASWDRLEAISDSPQQLQRVVGLLAGSQQRLIITDEKTVEVAHEALLSEWKLLNSWIAENLENIRLSRSLEEDCQEWVERFNKSDDALLAGAKLAVISEWFDKNQPRVTPQETDFLRKSLQRRDRQNQAELERAKKLQREAEAKAKAESERTRLAIAASILVALSLGLGLLTQQLRVQKKQQQAIASGALVGTSEQLLVVGNQLEAMIASIQALKVLQHLGGNNFDALIRLKLVMDEVQEHNRLEGHKGEVTSVSFNHTQNSIATASGDKSIKLWDINGQLKSTFVGHTDIISKVKFSPDDKIIASASYDGTVKIWTLKGDVLRTFKHQKLVYDVSFSPQNEEIIASGSGDGNIQLWNIKTGKKININFPKMMPLDKILSLDFSHDGYNIVFSRNNDNYIRVWNIKNNKIKVLGKHDNLVSDVKFGSGQNDNLVASSDYTGNIKIWDFKQEKLVKNIKTSEDEDLIYSLAFSPNGKILASSGQSQNRIIQLWDINGNSMGVIKGHTGFINQIIFVENNVIASASKDKTARIWRIADFKNDNGFTDLNVDKLLELGCNWMGDYLNNGKDKPALENKYMCENKSD